MSTPSFLRGKRHAARRLSNPLGWKSQATQHAQLFDDCVQHEVRGEKGAGQEVARSRDVPLCAPRTQA